MPGSVFLVSPGASDPHTAHMAQLKGRCRHPSACVHSGLTTTMTSPKLSAQDDAGGRDGWVCAEGQHPARSTRGAQHLFISFLLELPASSPPRSSWEAGRWHFSTLVCPLESPGQLLPLSPLPRPHDPEHFFIYFFF